ncbi:hypothetical protein PUN28_008586 [Cardiocondyla obscurior]|uniref:Uncharacterized protein n=1 Tax=Cardiocondyla obscurior TaxID=286306 RepID=A0AAW2G384_9HYME
MPYERFLFLFVCRANRSYDLHADYPRSCDFVGLFLHASRTIDGSYPPRTRAILRASPGELVRPPSPARKNPTLGAASALANESIFEIGRRPATVIIIQPRINIASNVLVYIFLQLEKIARLKLSKRRVIFRDFFFNWSIYFPLIFKNNLSK